MRPVSAEGVTMGRMADPDDSAQRVGPEAVVRRIVIVLVLLVVAFVLWRIFATAVPRTWSQHVAKQVDSKMSRGIFWGLFYGFVCSVIPVLVAWQARRTFLNWAWKLVVLLIAVLLALPNLLTLGISLGDNSASDAAWLKLTTDAPGFQWASLFGAIAGVLLALVVIVTGVMMRRRKSEVRDLKGQLADRDAPAPAPTDSTPEKEPPHA